MVEKELGRVLPSGRAGIEYVARNKIRPGAYAFTNNITIRPETEYSGTRWKPVKWTGI